MAMEQEVLSSLIYGATIFLLLSFVIVALLWWKTKCSVYGWFFSHLIFLSFEIVYWVHILQKPPVGDVFESESNSIYIGLAGSSWGISMLFFIKGMQRIAKLIK
ncbi:hypothetical protein [Bacillus sp. 123MFChir2]|uniref:hypothetical protein n=1 Tax=Bacillus sp. 123MFChir2 TaxID=1169144 RepID=UPI00035E4F14|nr:hypothetical protein [Bacillus sp. 123MFChir2]